MQIQYIIGFVVAQVVVFIAFIAYFKKVMFDDTTSAITRVTKLDNMNREKEKVLLQKLDETEKYLAKRKKEIEDDEKTVKQEAQRAALQLQEDILKKAKAEASEIIKKAQGSREKMRMDAMIEAEGKIIDFCREVMGRILSEAVTSQVNEQIVEEFMKEVEEADISRVGRDVETVEIHSAHKLSEKSHELIKALMAKKLGREVKLEYKEDGKLLGGAVMKFGTMLIDGSLYDKLKDTSDKMKEELNWKYNI